jgi:hypothetical protein
VLILNNLGKCEDAAMIGRRALRHYPDFGALYLATAQRAEEFQGRRGCESHDRGGRTALKNEAAFN